MRLYIAALPHISHIPSRSPDSLTDKPLVQLLQLPFLGNAGCTRITSSISHYCSITLSPSCTSYSGPGTIYRFYLRSSSSYDVCSAHFARFHRSTNTLLITLSELHFLILFALLHAMEDLYEIPSSEGFLGNNLVTSSILGRIQPECFIEVARKLRIALPDSLIAGCQLVDTKKSICRAQRSDFLKRKC